MADASPPLGTKFDSQKPRWDLLPLGPVEDVVKVLTHGAVKYSDNNWRYVPNAHDRYYAAAMRHLVACRQGERMDPESGLPHLAHAVCCLLFLMWFDDHPQNPSYRVGYEREEQPS